MSSAHPPVADGVWRLGNGVVNLYVVEQDEQYTIVDAGCPKHLSQVISLLESHGHDLDRVAALVLTHAHADHIGFAEEARTRSGAPVRVHREDEVIAQGGDDGRSNEKGMLGYVWRPAAIRTIFELARDGGTKIVPVEETVPFEDGDSLDVPGDLEVVHAPGHTRGSVALHAAERRVLLSGDTLVTWNPLTGRSGPQIMPAAFNESSAQALESLGRIETVDASTLLPGHGQPSSGDLAKAVAAARQAGPS